MLSKHSNKQKNSLVWIYNQEKIYENGSFPLQKGGEGIFFRIRVVATDSYRPRKYFSHFRPAKMFRRCCRKMLNKTHPIRPATNQAETLKFVLVQLSPWSILVGRLYWLVNINWTFQILLLNRRTPSRIASSGEFSKLVSRVAQFALQIFVIVI